MSVFFTADPHFFHSNIIIYCNRPWLQKDDLNEEGKWKNKDIKKQRALEMNEDLVRIWNSVVSPKDSVYICGDFALSNNEDEINKLVDSLHGDKYLITGDHDSNAVKKCDKFKWIRRLSTSITIEKQPIVLSHWAYLVWGKSHYGSYNLYGHSHGNLKEDINKLSFDVGVDSWGFKPTSFDQVKEKMSHKTFTPINKRRN